MNESSVNISREDDFEAAANDTFSKSRTVMHFRNFA